MWEERLRTGLEIVRGKVSKIMPISTVVTTTNGSESKTEVEISFEEDLKGLKVGFLVDCDIVVEVETGATFVPILSIGSDDTGENFVYVVNDENLAEKRYVTVGTLNGVTMQVDNVEVGEKVVSSRVKYLSDGELLNPIEAD